MWWGQYALTFGAAVLLSVGAFSGRARGFAALLGAMVWFVLGNASAAVVYYDAAGTQHVAQSLPLTWLCYGVAAIHLVVLLLTVHDILTDDSPVDSADGLTDALDPANANAETDHPFDNT